MSRIRILIAVCAAVAVFGALATVSSAATKTLYSTPMTGEQEDPVGDPDGTGTATLRVTPTRVCYDIRPKKAGRTFAAAHIHVGKRGDTGAVFITLWSSAKTVRAGKLTGCSKRIRSADLDKVKSKPADHYLNIHNATYPSGAIRGQLTATKLS